MNDVLTIDFKKEPLSVLRELVNVLGGRTRIEILKKIEEKDFTTSQLAKNLHCSIGNISQQITKLENAGLVIRRDSKSFGKNAKIVKPVYKKIEIIF